MHPGREFQSGLRRLTGAFGQRQSRGASVIEIELREISICLREPLTWRVQWVLAGQTWDLEAIDDIE